MLSTTELERPAMRPAAATKPYALIVEDEPALIEALREHRIAGAALDVFSREPLPADSPLWDLDNIVMTPHIAAGTDRYYERATDIFCANLRRYIAGEPLEFLVDPRATQG